MNDEEKRIFFKFNIKDSLRINYLKQQQQQKTNEVMAKKQRRLQNDNVVHNASYYFLWLWNQMRKQKILFLSSNLSRTGIGFFPVQTIYFHW